MKLNYRDKIIAGVLLAIVILLIGFFVPVKNMNNKNKADKKILAEKQTIKADYEAKIKAKDEEMKKAAEKYAENDKVVSDLTLRAENAEKSLLRAEVASEHKLPYELASRLLGETKEDMQKDAELLASYMKPQSAPPAYTSTPAGSAAAHGNHDAAYMALLDGITGQSIGG
jgi:hypothetical protein